MRKAIFFGIFIFVIVTQNSWGQNQNNNTVQSKAREKNCGENKANFYTAASGKVGIGTFNPIGKITVATSNNNFGFVHTDETVTIGSWIGSRDTSNGGWFGTLSNHALHFFTNDSMPQLTIQPTGKVNIANLLEVNGITKTKVLTITGGADLSEPFPMSDENSIPEGAVVIIDTVNPGQLKLSYKPYDACVAGIVSGAGGINPGITLQQEGRVEKGINVALNGQVYALATSANGAIKPGDLLTTSNIPGHAMKATDREMSHGAIIGKALTFLDKGEGMVLVLVNLH